MFEQQGVRGAGGCGWRRDDSEFSVSVLSLKIYEQPGVGKGSRKGEEGREKSNGVPRGGSCGRQ